MLNRYTVNEQHIQVGPDLSVQQQSPVLSMGGREEIRKEGEGLLVGRPVRWVAGVGGWVTGRTVG